MGFTDKLKAKAAELGLDEKAQLAKEKAAAAADGNRGKIADAVQRAGATVNEKTGGKYADKITKAQDAAMTGVDKVAATGTAAGAAGTTTGAATAQTAMRWQVTAGATTQRQATAAATTINTLPRPPASASRPATRAATISSPAAVDTVHRPLKNLPRTFIGLPPVGCSTRICGGTPDPRNACRKRP